MIRRGLTDVDHGVGVPRHDELSDDALVAGMAVLDGEAAAAFVRRFQRRVYGLALHMVGDRSLAEDVAQTAFLRAWRAASTYDVRRGTVVSWVLTIARNASIDAIRARRIQPVDAVRLHEMVESSLRGDTVSADSTADTAASRVDATAVLARVRLLPDAQARAVVLAVIGGCTGEEIAQLDGIPLGTVKSRIRLGLHRLRADLSAWAEEPIR